MIYTLSIMKYTVAATALFCLPTADAFAVVPRTGQRSTTSLRAGEYENMDGEGKINLKVSRIT